MLDTNVLFTYQFSFSGALTRAKSALQSTKVNEVRLLIHPRNFGSHVTVRRPVRPHHRYTNVK